MDWTSDRLEATVERVNRLRLRYDTLKRRLRRADGVDEIERLDASILRRRTRMRHLDAQIERLVQERDRLEGEVLGCFHGAEALLVDLIDRLEALDGPSWSPEPIPGYVVFEIVVGTIHDGDHRWAAPTLRPECPSGIQDAPHTRAGCVSQACGVLAWKSIEDLPDLDGGGLRAVAELAMNGRVIEHTHGYRAEFAQLVAIVAFDDNRWFHSRDAEQIDAFVSAPAETFAALAAPIPADAMLYVELDLFFGARR